MNIVLKSGVSLPVNTVNRLGDNTISISFSGINDYSDLRNKVNTSAMKQFKFYASETSCEIYEGFTKFVSPASISEAGDVLLTFEKEDEVSQRLRVLEESTSTQQVVLDAITQELLPAIVEMIG